MWNKTVLKLQPNFSVDKFTKKHFWVLQLSQLYYHDYRLLLHGTKVIFSKLSACLSKQVVKIMVLFHRCRLQPSENGKKSPFTIHFKA